MDNNTIEKMAQDPELMASVLGLSYWDQDEQVVWVDARRGAEFMCALLQTLPNERMLNIVHLRCQGKTLVDIAGELGLHTRERVRQIDAKARRLMRRQMIEWEWAEAMAGTVKLVPVPGGARDPDWVSVRQAHDLTGYTPDHLRYLVRTRRVVGRVNAFCRNELQIERESLKAYVLEPGKNGRPRKGVWKGE
jgi:hypothetical protein